MTGKQPRNIDGLPFTSQGKLDRRASNPGRPPKPLGNLFVRYKPGDSKPWHVMRRSAEGEPAVRVTRHRTEELANASKDRLYGG
jgi:hypothetical protein